jgi:hypothetical protein
MTEPVVIMRPNGKPFRPRKVVAEAVAGEYEVVAGVIVFGTHDAVAAQPLADQCAVREAGSGYAATDPSPVWWRDGFESGNRKWIYDEKHGRAGVWFREIVEVAVST